MTQEQDGVQKNKPRPLPAAPNPPAQRPNTPVQSTPQPISPTPSYSSINPPPLPARSKAGSTHTTYISPPPTTESGKPPGYNELDLDFREPQLIQSDTLGTIPEVHIENHWNDYDTWNNPDVTSDWDAPIQTDWATQSLIPYKQVQVQMEGRSDLEETNWWDPDLRAQYQRPGPGILPPMLYQELHDTNHTLFNITVLPPDIAAPVSRSNSMSTSTSTPTPTPPPLPPPSLPPASSDKLRPVRPVYSRPSEQELHTAVPHPNAYFCPRENCWVILQWKSSTIPPPFATSFLQRIESNLGATSYHGGCLFLPNQDRRKLIVNCMDESPVGPRPNRTHHFHKYPSSIDAHKLTPPFKANGWDALDILKKQRRAGAFVAKDQVQAEHERTRAETPEIHISEEDEESEGQLMDLYMCCQCQLYVVASSIVPGVISIQVWTEFIRDKRVNPPVGKSPELATILAMETLLTTIENPLYKGVTRQLKVNSPTFQKKIGWNQNTKQLFVSLGFNEDKTDGGDSLLRPPSLDSTNPQGRVNRTRFLRAWVEITACLQDFLKLNRSKLDPEAKTNRPKLWVILDPCRELYQNAIGAHPDQIPFNELSELAQSALISCDKTLTSFGMTPSTYSQELLTFAYFAQCRCDPANTMVYYTNLSKIVAALQEAAQNTEELQEVIFSERSRDRFVEQEFMESVAVLGFGLDKSLGIEYDNDVDDTWIENAWKACHKSAWIESSGNATQADSVARRANDALKIIAEARQSVQLKKLWDGWRDRTVMSSDRAYETLEVYPHMDDELLITVYNMRMEESTDIQRRRMRDALLALAEERNSLRLHEFYVTGKDPGICVPPINPELPRGLNQLGNTCYLNSLLQYFYTIKDLRDAVLPLGILDLKSQDDGKLTDDDLKKHRVGGRLVTRREIIRSKKFVTQLAQLFCNLEVDDRPSISPTKELAKLALITSRDEEEDEVAQTDSSNDTDATLVEDGGTSTTQQGNSDRKWTDDMDIDAVVVSSPIDKEGDPLPGSSPSKAESSSSIPTVKNDQEMEAEPASERPLPLPPQSHDTSIMMFGRQHDVAECMDNCMFQIETALLKFDDTSESSDSMEHRSIVKRLFYGRLRQQIVPEPGQSAPDRSSIHVKEDLFSHIHLNVAEDGLDVYDLLTDFFDDNVDFGGKKARMEVTLLEPPALLQIQLQRVQFNRDTLQQYKCQAYVKLDETIYLDRFLDNLPPLKKIRSKAIQRELSDSRERLRMLLKGKEEPFLTALETTHAALSEHVTLPGVNEQLLHDLLDEQQLFRTEMDQLRDTIERLRKELDELWGDTSSQSVAYELTSVFVHRGTTPTFGHYFFYARNLPHNPDEWFKYNDESVQVVSKDEVLQDTTGSNANPYLLVFARKDSQVVDTVHRIDSSKMETLP